MSDIPTPLSLWQHHNGRIYRVLFVTNTANPSPKYPPDVVYESVVNGNRWSRPLSAWAGSFVQVPTVRVEICPQCGSRVVQPRDSADYCEECGWPDENRGAPAPPWGWTKFPTVTGQQFVAIPGEVWIGSVNIGKDSPERGRKVSVWKGGSVYTLWECDFEKWGFRFKQIDWPVNPLTLNTPT